MWKCDKCGSDEVQQEYAFLRSMNDTDSEYCLDIREENSSNCLDIIDDAINAWKKDFFWCVDCDEECSPIRK